MRKIKKKTKALLTNEELMKVQNQKIKELIRTINISRYESNTHYSVSVVDSYGTEHHLGYWSELDNSVMLVIEAKARGIWANEVEPEEDLMGKAVLDCICLDEIRGIKPDLD
tara:strand:+ start:196 stop:531 length:336 start_codon:yes stop_codon:yes gene_type:complete